jgi:hypothetical protein
MQARESAEVKEADHQPRIECTITYPKMGKYDERKHGIEHIKLNSILKVLEPDSNRKIE